MLKLREFQIILGLLCSLLLLISSTEVQARTNFRSPASKTTTLQDQLKAASDKLAENPEDPVLNLEVGKLLLKLGRYEQALPNLQKASAVSSREASLLLAVAYGKKADYVNAIRVLEAHVKKEERDAEAHELLGKAYAKTNRYDDAAQAFRKSFSINQKRKSAYDGLLDLFIQTKNNYETRALLNDMIKVFGANAKWLKELCRAYTAESFLANAIDTCRKAIDMDPKTPDNYLNLGISLKNSQKMDEATKLLVKTANDFPQSADAQKAAGQIHDELKNWEAAVHFYARCTKLMALEDVCWIRLGVSHFELGNYKDSVTAFARACEISPRNIAEFRRCASQLKIKNNSEMAQEFQTAIDKCSAR